MGYPETPSKSDVTVDQKSLSQNDAAVISHVEMYQSIITRMANNSVACKQWCIVLVSAILVFVVEQKRGDMAILAAGPIIIFGFLDAYYLGLEKQFRDAFNESMKKLRSREFFLSDLFVVKATGKIPVSKHMGDAILSWATWPVYLGLLSIMVIAGCYA